MHGIASAARSRACAATVATTLVLGLWVTGVCAQDASASQLPDATESARMPVEVHGFWDLAPEPCVVGPHAESDSRLEIGAYVVRGYEELMEVREVTPVSDVPLAWRVIAISDIAPPHLQGPALYVLSGDSLTIADAGQARTYVRCREATARGDEP
ncbi:hypothetical protein [Luteimonas sp. J29]|jgi:hypothetical protein|nr:hypothetical protein [Luteimonas sp. J29]